MPESARPEMPAEQRPTEVGDVNIGNYDAFPPEETQRLLDAAWAMVHEGHRKQDEALALAAEASRQIAEGNRVIELLRFRAQ